MQPAIDGRVQRGERNRTAIVDALLTLLEEGNGRPSGREIAERAGVSLRSVFQHFDDMESLYAECVRRQHDKIAPMLVAIDSSLPRDDRVEALVAQRGRIYERIAPIRRAGVIAAADSPVLRKGLTTTAARFRQQLADVFASEIGGDDELLAALDVVASFDAWEQLRTSQQCSPAMARRVMTRAVKEMLA
jgi:AcrR family transcriptional regulator